MHSDASKPLPNEARPPATMADRAKRLFTYLAERTKLRSGRVQDIRGSSKYPTVMWLDQLPNIPEVLSIHRETPAPAPADVDADEAGSDEPEDDNESEGRVVDDSVLIRMARPKLPQLPAPPKEVEPWLRGGQKTLARWDTEPPTLLEFILEAVSIQRDGESVSEDRRVTLSERPRVAQAWAQYIEESWKPWAQERSRLEPHRQCYSELFELRTQVEREGEDYELVLASGLLSGANERQPVYRHLVTQAARIELDVKSGSIGVFPASTSAFVRLETEMLPTARQPKLDGLPQVEKRSTGDVRLDVASSVARVEVMGTLSGWANRLDANCTVSDSARQPRPPAEDQPPVVAFAPALILRKRPAISLTAVFEQCAEQIDSPSAEVPFNVARVVDVIADKGSDSVSTDADKERISATRSAPLFPLPYNDAQVQVAKRLRQQRGVLVQGPPGTGKTLTIANLICHLLAEGKRILVTSAKARPLTVLYDKLPSQLKPLCLTSLGGGREETERLRASVQGILDRHSTYDRDESGREERRLDDLLDNLAEQRARLMNQRRDRWELEARGDHKIAGGNYAGQAMEIAEQVNAGLPEFEWFTDGIDREQGFPLSSSDEVQLEAFLRDISPGLRDQCAKRLPEAARLATPSELELTLGQHAELTERKEQIAAEINRVHVQLKDAQASRLAHMRSEVNAELERLKSAEGDYAVASAKAARERARVNTKKKAIEAEHTKLVQELTRRWQPDLVEAETALSAAHRVMESVSGVPGRPGELSRMLLALDRMTLGQLQVALRELHVVANGKSAQTRGRPGALEWRQRAIRDCLNGRSDRWASLYDLTARELEALPAIERMKDLSTLRVELPPDVDEQMVLEDARDLRDHFARGGGKGWPGFRPRTVKQAAYIMKRAYIDGAPCNNAKTLGHLVEFLDVEGALRTASELWIEVGIRDSRFDIDGDPLEKTFDQIKGELFDPLMRILELAPVIRRSFGALVTDVPSVEATKQAVEAAMGVKDCDEALRELRDRIEAEMKPLSAECDEQLLAAEREWSAPDDSAVQQAKAVVEQLQDDMREQAASIADEYERELGPLRSALDDTTGQLDQLAGRLKATTDVLSDVSRVEAAHPACERMYRAVVAGDQGVYAEGYTQLEVVRKALPGYQAGTIVLERLTSHAPRFAESLRSAEYDDRWKPRLRSLRQAWEWAQARAWVRHFRTLVDANLDEKLATVESTTAQTLAEKAALLAWRHCLEAATEEQKRALTAWQLAMRKFGKGTGRHAPRFKRQASSAMQKAQGMIPALVTPLARLVESLTVRPKLFDVVIADEASQLGPEGLLLFYIAEKVIIVGDDKQISPEDVGQDLRDIQALVRRHIPDVPQAERYEQESLFNIGEMLFSDGRLMLREHFRCMPEIIKFSNDLCYRDKETGKPQLQPLRKVSGKRLEPVLKPVFVPGGNRTGHTNKPEIDAIVEAVCQCAESPEYSGKTFGVVSLHSGGGEQADAIQRALIQALGADEVDARRIISGNAYAFQGDERDVMFLSLVAAVGDTRITPLTKEADERRFNVAASRAKDQMWLFHSVQPADLKQDDLRYKLLMHFKAPPETLDYSFDRQLVQCQSKFERDVATRVVGRGFRVYTQFKVAGYSIDLVVEGADGKQLAVECDGDYWHGPEKFDDDMKRQRILERCGWKFWRVWGSEFYDQPEGALSSLWRLLEAQGIKPQAS